MNYKDEDLINIYKELKTGVLNYNELLPIKDKLLFIVNSINLTYTFSIKQLISVLFKLQKENRLDLIDKELIIFLKKYHEDNYIPLILEGLTYTNERLSNNIFENESIIESLNFSFYAISNILLEDINSFNYLNNKNSTYTNLVVRFINIKNDLFEKNYHRNDLYVLLSILEIITSFIYINIEEFEYDFDLINKCMDLIEKNIVTYFYYFIKNDLWNMNILERPVSSGGFIKEFIIIGNIVNDIYKKEKVVKIRQKYC